MVASRRAAAGTAGLENIESSGDAVQMVAKRSAVALLVATAGSRSSDSAAVARCGTAAKEIVDSTELVVVVGGVVASTEYKVRLGIEKHHISAAEWE